MMSVSCYGAAGSREAAVDRCPRMYAMNRKVRYALVVIGIIAFVALYFGSGDLPGWALGLAVLVLLVLSVVQDVTLARKQ